MCQDVSKEINNKVCVFVNNIFLFWGENIILGPTGIWTQVKGFKVLCTNHYTIGPHLGVREWGASRLIINYSWYLFRSSDLWVMSPTRCLCANQLFLILRGMHQLGIEPRAQPWKGRILPLNYWCFGGLECVNWELNPGHNLGKVAFYH